jgi:hypothetical protein
MAGYNANDPDADGDNDSAEMNNGSASTMSMGKNGVISDGAGPNVPGFGTPKPESKGPFARAIPPLTPKSAP